MSKTVKQITKIKLKDSGLKGLEVSYVHPEAKDNAIWSNEHVEKRKYPIHGELKKAINDLRNFMLEMCNYFPDGLSVQDKDLLIEDTRVIEIGIGGVDMFKITGDLRVIGDKFIKLGTPKVEAADGYEHFETVQNILKVIVTETKEYMEGKKKYDEGAFLLDFAKKKDDVVLIKEFESMSNKEKMNKCAEILEKLGACVLINEELEVNDIQLDVDFNTKEEESAPKEIEINSVKGTLTVTDVVEEPKVLVLEPAAPKEEVKEMVKEIISKTPSTDPIPVAEKIPAVQQTTPPAPLQMPAF